MAREFRSGLGRLGFAPEVLRGLKPFSAPLYAWISTIPDSGCRTIPGAILLLMLWIAKAIESRSMIPMRLKSVQLGERFRADAKAEGLKVVLGGWALAGSDVPTENSKWFAVELTPQTAPWAYCKGQPFKTIAALELFASLLSMMFLADAESDRTEAILLMTGATDNQANESVMKRCMTTKYPLCLILMELAAQMEARRLQLHLAWRRRDSNTEADSLTNGDYSLFNPDKRIHIDVTKMKWMVLPWLQSEAQIMYEEINVAKLAAKGSKPSKKRKTMLSLRITDPW